MKLSDIKTIIKSVPIIIAVALYLIFKPDNNEAVTITAEDAAAQTGTELYEVRYIDTSDGDTFNVEVDGQKERVRLLMVDTPEMNYKENNPQPYAEEAKQFTIELLEKANKIELLHDKGPKTDHYDRLLAYVFVDGVLLQERLLAEGYAAVRYINKPNNTLEQQFYAIQDVAKEEKRNVWSVDGYFDSKVGFQEDVVK